MPTEYHSANFKYVIYRKCIYVNINSEIHTNNCLPNLYYLHLNILLKDGIV